MIERFEDCHCAECGKRCENGEGYDGMCGECADEEQDMLDEQEALQDGYDS